MKRFKKINPNFKNVEGSTIIESNGDYTSLTVFTIWTNDFYYSEKYASDRFWSFAKTFTIYDESQNVHYLIETLEPAYTGISGNCCYIDLKCSISEIEEEQ